MFKIVKKRELNPTVTEMVIEAPLIAKKAKAGQFIIIRAKEDSERIPLTIAHYDAAAGTVAISFPDRRRRHHAAELPQRGRVCA